MDDHSGQFDVTAFARELASEPNHQVGTRLLLANDRVKVWEIVLGPSERVPFELAHAAVLLRLRLSGSRQDSLPEWLLRRRRRGGRRGCLYGTQRRRPRYPRLGERRR